MREWTTMAAADLGREIGAGRLDPRALTECFLDAIARFPEAERIYARLTPARARAEAAAAAARAAAGVRRGPLDGVPVSIKDLYDMAGVETEAGSRLLSGRIPAADAHAVRMLAAAGMPMLGKTHMTELAFSGLGVNPMTATPPNVHDPDWAPGGSSSGAAASVAFGLAPVGMGSDTGGSVRAPAAWNSLVGLKTTSGLISLEGVVPLAPSFDTIGPLTRTVEDAALVLSGLTGAPPPDLTGASLQGVALLVAEGAMFEGADPEPVAAFDAAVERLARAGARIGRAPVPEFGASLEAIGLYGSPVAAEGYAIWRETIEARPDAMHPPVRDRFRAGDAVTAADVEACRRLFADLARSCLARTAAWDAVIFPTSPILPPSATRLAEDNAYFADRNLLALRNTRVGNFLGLSGLTVPTGTPACGLLLNGRPIDEARLLRIGAAVERALAA
jgi:aspartyl-tRNA(Asn)/glutamyl-tRNA(Gln) amidotransferase subunit A